MIKSIQVKPTTRLLLLLVAILGLTSLSACKKRNLRKKQGISIEEVDKLLAMNEEGQLDFKTYSAKGKGKYEGPDQSIGFSYRINIAKDSLVWASMTKFGYEALRLRADQDTVMMRITDRKELIKCDFDLISNLVGMNVDFAMLQSIIIGNSLFLPDSLTPDGSNKEVVKLSGKYGTADLEYFIDRVLHKLVKMNANDESRGAKTSIVWSDFREVEIQKIAHSIALNVLGKETTHIVFNHSSIVLNGEKVRFSFKIPKSYTLKGCPVNNGK